MPGPDPRMQTPDRRKKRMGPKTFVVGEDGKREVLRGGKPAKQTPPQPNKFLTGGQTKIAKKAPPFDKIDEKDFAVLRAEKAKGRGKGLQDEKIKPGKVMKVKRGKFNDAGKFPAVNTAPGSMASKAKAMSSADEFLKRRKKLSGSVLKAGSNFLKRRGKISLALAAGVAGISGAKKLLDKRKAKKRDIAKVNKMGGGLAAATERLRAQGKMGGGMMKKYSKGSDYQGVIRAAARDKAKVGEGKKFRAKTFEDKGRLIPDTPRNRKRYNRMGGGMMNKPMPMYNQGGGADTGKVGEMKSRLGVLRNKVVRRRKELEGDIKGSIKPYVSKKANSSKQGALNLINRSLKILKDNKKMGGGMMNKPMGYKSGKSVMAKGCKLGRKKPTKMYT